VTTDVSRGVQPVVHHCQQVHGDDGHDEPEPQVSKPRIGIFASPSQPRRLLLPRSC
jgi:hypothetical protein